MCFGLANVAWSLATLKVFEKNDWGNVEGGKDERGTEMLDTIASNFAKCVTIQGGANVRPQAFSNLIWAYGNIKYKISDDDGVLSRIYSQCETSWVENSGCVETAGNGEFIGWHGTRRQRDGPMVIL